MSLALYIDKYDPDDDEERSRNLGSAERFLEKEVPDYLRCDNQAACSHGESYGKCICLQDIEPEKESQSVEDKADDEVEIQQSLGHLQPVQAGGAHQHVEAEQENAFNHGFFP